jgi:hypothetical protein
MSACRFDGYPISWTLRELVTINKMIAIFCHDSKKILDTYSKNLRYYEEFFCVRKFSKENCSPSKAQEGRDIFINHSDMVIVW